LRRLENFFPWTAERIISAHWADKSWAFLIKSS
jgi:hypothetical protein